MRTVLRLLVLLGMLLGLILVMPGTAHAAEDEVRHLDAQFDVQADGSMNVRYELQWRFAEKGRHGIDFRIATRENWDPDRTKDVVYRVDNIEVSSPSGAPAGFTERTYEDGSEEEIQLRIGDPDVELDTRDATYVISYRLRGAMRTFDDIPELQWDVVSDNYPDIKEMAVRVTGPDGVDQGICKTGYGEDCDAEVRDGVGHFGGRNIELATSVYVQFPAGSIANAEPTLERRRLGSPELLDYSAEFEVTPDGLTHGRHTVRYEFPVKDEEESVRWQMPDRLPWDDDRDQVIRYGDVRVVDDAGRELEWRWYPNYREYSYRTSDLRVEVPVDPANPVVTLVFSYTAEGAVGVDGATAALRLTPVPLYAYGAPRQVTYLLPGEVSGVRCFRVSARNGLDDCSLDEPPQVSGNQATGTWADGDGPTDHSDLYSVEFDAGAITGSVPPLAESLDRDRDRRSAMTWGTVLGGGAALVGLGLGVGRLRLGRDRRYADVPPGVVDAKGTQRAAGRDDEVPVAFNPPDVPLHIAGLLRDRFYRPTHLGALLVDLAVRGAVQLRSDPLSVVRAKDVDGLSQAERTIVREASDKLRGNLPTKSAQNMRKGVEREQKNYLKDRHWFQPTNDTLRWGLAVAVIGLPLAVGIWFVNWVNADTEFPPWIILIGAAIVGFGLARSQKARPALQARGRAALDQVEGFRTYIATAEADQLDFEADRDIFRRYLPWAVLFNLTDRWTRVCRELADAGKIDAPNTSFIVGHTSIDNLGSSISSFTSSMGSASKPPSASSGGSGGGSSGFSGGGSSGGGGGGGGTSASSW